MTDGPGERRSLRAAFLVWIPILAGLTALLWWFRDIFDEAHVALAYLLIVLGGSARHGRLVGLVLALLAFLTFNFFLMPPLYTLTIEDGLDWWILVAFLTTGAVAAQLFHRARSALETAERRAVEIDHLASERVRLAREADHVAALREADRLKDALLASVSHDLRTPLTTIRALGAELRETGDERAVVIEEEAERLNRFVEDLLDLSQIRSGGFSPKPELVAAEDLVGAALQRLRGVPGSERVEVSVPPGDVLPVGRFDFVQTLRALANLLENALRHSGGAPVELVVDDGPRELVLRVMDRGPGVPETHRDRIFDEFFRGDDGADTRGTGLGLAIARRVVEAQGGSITYRPRDGGGSIFELRVPGGAPNTPS